MKTVHSGVWRPDDRAASRYQYLPVEVSPGQPALTVRLSYERAAGRLDLGCFDPDGRFRGWSGGAREQFTLTERWATPGYRPGPLAAGTWSVVLGLHRVGPSGVPYSLAVAAGPADPPAARPRPPWPDRPARPRLPAPPGHRWLAGDLHAHSVHSDGTLTVPELARRAVAAGLDLLAVTDHNTVSHHPELADPELAGPGLRLIPGQEVTTDRGHANAFGAIDWVDFRTPADQWLSTVESQGGLLSINHPLAMDCAWLHRLTRRPPLAEVWHSGWWDRTWDAPLAWLQTYGPQTVPVGGSDFHDPAAGHPLGEPTTWILLPVTDPREATVDAVLGALAAGRVAISASPAGPALLRVDDELVAVGADGALLTDLSGRRRLVHGDRAVFPGAAGPHWLEDYRTEVLAIAG